MRPVTIANLVPHAGPMCLLEEVVAWDEFRAHCRTAGYWRTGHPLARAGRLSAVLCIEYAAQAAAVHGGLLARAQDDVDPGRKAAGRLVALKGCKWEREALAAAALDQALDVRVDRHLGGPAGSIYGFAIDSGNRILVTGRLTIKTGS